jgi:hypothetical protein
MRLSAEGPLRQFCRNLQIIRCSVEPVARTNRRTAPTLQPKLFPNIAKPEARGVKQA